MTKKNDKTLANQRTLRANKPLPDKLPFMEHVRELRRRLAVVAIAVCVGSAIAYAFEQQIINILLLPSHGQHFIYTSPLGGMNFLMSVCIDIGLILSTPVIIYQVLAFLHPLMKDTTRRFLRWLSAVSGAVALAGVAFGYFVGLPSALHFLLHQFTSMQVRPLITIQSYIQFVALYLLGCALMFQLPLIILMINRIKPMGPRTLLKYERHMIAGAVIVAFIMNPTPNIIDQLFVVLPIIASYQLSILLLWYIKRRGRPAQLQALIDQDNQRQAERTGRQLQPLDGPELATEPVLTAISEEEDEPTYALTPVAVKAGPAAAESEAENVMVRVVPTSAPTPAPASLPPAPLPITVASAATEPATVEVSTVRPTAEPVAEQPIITNPIAAAFESEPETIPVRRIATVKPMQRSAISVATAIEVANRSAKAPIATHIVVASKIPVTMPEEAKPAKPVEPVEPTPITYTPSSEVAERVKVHVIKPRPIQVKRRDFFPTLGSQLIQ